MKKATCLLLALTVLLMLMISACSSSPRPEASVEGFIKAYNKADFSAMLDYIDPSVAKSIKAVSSLLGGLVGADDILDFFPLIKIFGEGMEDAAEYPTISIKSMSAERSESTAMVSAVLESWGDEMQAVFELELIDGEWYIMNTY